MSNFAQEEKISKITKALSNKDVGFHSTTDKNVKNAVSVTKKRLLINLNKLVIGMDKNNESLTSADEESIFDNWKVIEDILENAFEKSDKAFDGLKRASTKRKRIDHENYQKEEQFQYLEDNSFRISETKKQKTVKPQIYFETPIDNTDSGPFTPKLKTKPFAMEPLQESLKLIDRAENVPEHYANPYKKEIMTQSYNANIFIKSEPIPSKDWSSTSAIWVDAEVGLNQMLESLKNYSEIAVDLEHHDLRSYYGLTCLMQISTRDQDYIIDTLALRHKASILNEIFCNPKITKIFHGAFMDIIWLQRDLGLYVVGLFDTYHASRALGFSKHSLAFLLENFAKFKTSKQYQLSDWRQRPLTAPLLSYARSDTHFLLNIFDQLRNMLIDSNKMEHVLSESRNVAVRRFENNKFRPNRLSPAVYSLQDKIDPWLTLARNYNMPLYLEPLIKELYFWRDNIARCEDESPRYIMSNQFLANLVISRPVDANDILSINGQMTTFISKNTHNLCQLIKNCVKNIKQISGFDGILQNDNNALHSVSLLDISNDQVVHARNNFEKIIASIGNSNKQLLHDNDTNSMDFLFTLPKSQWKKSSKVISYKLNNNSDKIIEESEFNEREKALDQSFKTPLKLSETSIVSLINSKEVEAKEEDVENVLDTEHKPSSTDVSGLSKGDEDIIVLNPKRVAQRKEHFEKLEKEQFNADIIPLNYETGSKMLRDPTFKNTKAKKKKRALAKNKKQSFNPYEENTNSKTTKSFTQPQRPLQRKRTGSGKSITFKKK